MVRLTCRVRSLHAIHKCLRCTPTTTTAGQLNRWQRAATPRPLPTGEGRSLGHTGKRESMSLQLFLQKQKREPFKLTHEREDKKSVNDSNNFDNQQKTYST